MTRRWGILGTGAIAHKFAAALPQSDNGTLVAVGSRTQTSADAFAAEFGGTAHASYEALAADPDVDVVYISLPNHLHLSWTLACLREGKNVLCEKPFTLNAFEAQRAIEAAQFYDRFLMEAFMYRCHPQTAKVVELVRSGAIGDVRFISAAFGWQMGGDWSQSRFAYADGGGAIMDVGCYPVSLAQLVTGEAFSELKAVANLHGVDDLSTASVRYPGGAQASLVTGVSANVGTAVKIVGSKGSIELPMPWIPGPGDNTFTVNGEPVTVTGGKDVYALEADVVDRSIDARQAPEMPWQDTLDNMRTLDAWRAAIGLVWPSEREGSTLVAPVKRANAPMTYGEIDGVGKPVSRLILGSIMMQPGRLPLTSALLDTYVELGGNTIDTARVYGSEPGVGEWLRLRGIREELVIIAKGAHPWGGDEFRVRPDKINEDLLNSLDVMGLDYADLYVLHRDDPDVPVGEIVDLLDGHRRAGRIRAYGGSNWTAPRLQAANEYAAAHGKSPMVCSSPNLALAIGNDVPWTGCLSISGNHAELDWYAQTRLPLLSWSSQCQGFFTDRAFSSEMRRVWVNDANVERKQRCAKLGAQLGYDANQVALAWLLHQRQDVYPLIGPFTVAELSNSIAVLQIQLTPEQTSWLNLEI